MGQKVTFVDDLDGTELPDGFDACNTFALNGSFYKIDLSEANAQALADALAPFIAAAESYTPEPPKSRGRKASTGGRGGSKPRRADDETWLARKWYQADGGEIGDRGRVPEHVVSAYRTAVERGDVDAQFLPGFDGERTHPVFGGAAESAGADADEAPEAEDVADVADEAADDEDPFGEAEGAPAEANEEDKPKRSRRGVAKSA